MVRSFRIVHPRSKNFRSPVANRPSFCWSAGPNRAVSLPAPPFAALLWPVILFRTSLPSNRRMTAVPVFCAGMPDPSQVMEIDVRPQYIHYPHSAGLTLAFLDPRFLPSPPVAVKGASRNNSIAFPAPPIESDGRRALLLVGS